MSWPFFSKSKGRSLVGLSFKQPVSSKLKLKGCCYMPMLIIFIVTRKWSEGEDFHIFWKSHKKQKEGFTVSLENTFLEKPKETKEDKIKFSNWHHAAFLGLGNFIWKHCLHHWCTRVVLLNVTSLHKPHCPFSITFKRFF